jgi:hypothetical protein
MEHKYLLDSLGLQRLLYQVDSSDAGYIHLPSYFQRLFREKQLLMLLHIGNL